MSYHQNACKNKKRRHHGGVTTACRQIRRFRHFAPLKFETTDSHTNGYTCVQQVSNKRKTAFLENEKNDQSALPLLPSPDLVTLDGSVAVLQIEAYELSGQPQKRYSAFSHPIIDRP